MLSLLFRVRLVPPRLWVTVLLLIPLIKIKIVTHLPHCLGVRSLVLHRHLSQPSIHIKLHIAAIQDILVVIVHSYIFVALYTLILLACISSLPLCLLYLLTHPLHITLFLLLLVLLRRRGRRW